MFLTSTVSASMVDVLVSSLQPMAQEAISIIIDVLDIALPVAAVFMVVNLGLKIFKKITMDNFYEADMPSDWEEKYDSWDDYFDEIGW